MGDNSSDELVDIQIEDSLVRETLMNIDSASNPSDHLCMGVTTALLFVFACILGFFGPPEIYKHKTGPYELGHLDSQATQIKLDLVDISSFNSFMSLGLAFQSGTEDDIEGKIRYKYEAEFRDSTGKRVHTLNTKLSALNVKASPEDAPQKNVRIWSENLIDFENMSINIHLDTIPKEMEQVSAIITMGHPSHTVFQMFVRVAMAVIGFVILVILTKRLCAMSVRYWHLEQKLTVPLLVLVVLYDNPVFFITHAYSPSKAYIVLNTLLVSIFLTYFRFFILVLFDSLRYKNRKIGKYFLLPKVLFAVLFFMVSVVRGIYHDIASFEIPAQDDPNERIIMWAGFTVHSVYLLWLVIAVLFASSQVDITEKYKFQMYMRLCLFVLLLLVFVFVTDYNMAKSQGDFIAGTSIRFMVNYAIANLVVFRMAYFHYPLECLSDRRGNSGGDVGAQGIPEDDFEGEPRLEIVDDAEGNL